MKKLRDPGPGDAHPGGQGRLRQAGVSVELGAQISGLAQESLDAGRPKGSGALGIEGIGVLLAEEGLPAMGRAPDAEGVRVLEARSVLISVGFGEPLRAERFEKLSEWLAQYRRLWEGRLDNFEVELERRTSALKSKNQESWMSERQVIERAWQAPIDRVWELWTTAEGIASWLGPRGFTVDVEEIDLRASGTFRYTMRATEPEAVAAMEKRGQPASHVIASTFTEVDPPNKLVYDSPFGPETMTTSVEFSEGPEGVKMVLVISATKAGMTGGAVMGWKSSLERFAEQLA